MKETMRRTMQAKLHKIACRLSVATDHAARKPVPQANVQTICPEKKQSALSVSHEDSSARRITSEQIDAFETALFLREKSPATIQKYVRQVQDFATWLDGKPASQQKAIEYKQYLKEVLHRKNRTINTIVAALNSFFQQQGWEDIRLTSLKIQQEMFLDENKLLSMEEYWQLCETARAQGDEQFALILQTICSTGIRVSELKYITVDAVLQRQREVDCKGKIRKIVLPKTLAKALKKYCRRKGITKGEVFRNKKGTSVTRYEIWKKMKALCITAGVQKEKVYPHNLRHLFARTFYAATKDIVKLADLLGHSNIQTTRIYTLGTLQEEYTRLDSLGLAQAS